MYEANAKAEESSGCMPSKGASRSASGTLSKSYAVHVDAVSQGLRIQHLRNCSRIYEESHSVPMVHFIDSPAAEEWVL